MTTEEPEKEASTDKPPVLDDFETYEQYQDARDEHRDNKLRAEFEERLARRDADTQRKTSWNEKSEAALEKHADFHEVMATATVPNNPDVVTGISQHEKGAEIAYHLGQHPEVVERLDALSPQAALIEIGNIAASLTSEEPPSVPDKKPLTVPKTPKPVKPLGATNRATALNVDDKGESVNLASYGKHVEETEPEQRR